MNLPLPTVITLAFVAMVLARTFALDHIGEPVRKFLYAKQAHWGKPGVWLHYLFTCPWCLAVWFSGLAVLWWVWLVLPAWPGFGFVALMCGAVAGAASLMVSLAMTAHRYVEG